MRRWLVLCSTLAWLRSGAAEVDFTSLDREFASTARPLVEKYCYGCHSTEKHKGDLDLEHFRTLSEVRQGARAWEKTLEMLLSGEMPPKDKPRPSITEREQLEKWLRAFLDAEGRAQAGDPGRVVLRRLSNTEYTLTVRDLTGVPLDPAKEFPIDGAAGEGFVNTGEALVMSPSLLDKYLAAAKDIASHAVLLPDGFRFAVGTRRGDWIEELLGRIRAFYARYTDREGGTRINLQGIQFDTNTGGRLPIEKYLAVTLSEREALSRGQKSFAAVAAANGLNARYLGSLWTLLNSSEPSVLLDGLRARWRAATPADAGALAADVLRWQAVLTKFQTVGHMKPWMVPVNPLATREEFRLKLPPATNGSSISVWLSAGTAGDGAEGDVVVWQQPRLVIPGRPTLLLRDVRETVRVLSARRLQLFASTAGCLEAAAEVGANGGKSPLPDRAELAGRFNVDAAAVAAWFEYLGIGESTALHLDYFTNRLSRIGNYDFVSGWGSPDTPNMAANASGQAVRIPGNLKPHGLTVHPSPKLQTAVGWRSPVAAGVKVEARVTHAHPECGNGVTWSLELRRGATRQRLAAGVSQGSKEVKAGPITDLTVQPGDLVSLLIGPRDGNHACDLTDVELLVTTVGEGGREWNLTREVAGSIHAGNPHADAFGNEGIWHFYTEPVSGAGELGPVIPAGSLLARWQSAGSREDKRRLAGQVQQLLIEGVKPATPAPDVALYRQLASLGGPLLAGVRVESPGASSASAPAAGAGALEWGLDPALFGRLPEAAAGNVDAADLAVRAPATLEIRLPADLVEGCELVGAGTLHPVAGAKGSVQFQVGMRRADVGSNLLPGTTIVVPEAAEARQRFVAAFDEFRRWFPAALCYPKIVPVDEVITLTVFHREDDALVRLMLDETERAQLDRLWEELRYIGQDALTIVDAYAQLMEYATQDSDPKLFAHLRQPIDQRAAAFRELLRSAEAKHLDALLDFANRAFRRPVTDAEKQELRELYGRLRKEELAHDEAFRLTLARLFVSPAFLYRAEQPAPGDRPQPVSNWELANRLSYFLWSSMPDDRLRVAAASGSLHDPEVLRSQANRLLQDRRARSLATEFTAQWLHIRDFESLEEKSERVFPGFVGLRQDMYEESVRFFLDLFQRDGSILELIDADHTFLNEALAKHYGIPGVTGPEWRRVNGVHPYGRGGILGMATVLTKQSGASRTSPILRGNFISEVLLGDKLPKPPKNVPRLPESEADTGDLTLRQTIEKHSSVPECALCHVRIDPYGFALENYDAIGRHRENDLGGRPIDARAQLKWRDDRILDGLPGLRNYLLTRKRDDFVRTFCRKFLGYALGRGLKLSDGPLLETMQERLQQNGYRFSAALEVILQSPQFHQQRGLEATKEDEI